jgi:hypothetical protein
MLVRGPSGKVLQRSKTKWGKKDGKALSFKIKETKKPPPKKKIFERGYT